MIDLVIFAGITALGYLALVAIDRLAYRQKLPVQTKWSGIVNATIKAYVRTQEQNILRNRRLVELMKGDDPPPAPAQECERVHVVKDGIGCYKGELCRVSVDLRSRTVFVMPYVKGVHDLPYEKMREVEFRFNGGFFQGECDRWTTRSCLERSRSVWNTASKTMSPTTPGPTP